MSGGTASDAAGSGERRETEGTRTGLLGKIGRWFVYYVLLLLSVDWAVQQVLEHVVIAPDIDGLVAVVGATVLAVRSDPPAYGRTALFAFGSLGLWWVLDVVVGPTVPTRGSPYPILDVALTWLAALLFGYVVAFGVDWGAVAEGLPSRESRG
jgi:hypothetical protein